MQKEVGEQRTDHSPLRTAFGSLLQGSVRSLYRRAEPPRDVQSEPRNIGVVRHGFLDQGPIQVVEKPRDVKIDDPVEVPASLPRCPYRVECRSAGSIAVGVRVEDWFHERLQDHFRDRLCDAIGYGGHA